DRTDDVAKRMAEIGLKTPGVAGAVQFSGMSVNDYTPSSNAAIDFFTLTDFDKRPKGMSAAAIAGELNKRFASIQDAFIAVFPAPPVIGLGTLGGFKLQVEDRADAGPKALYDATQNVLKQGYQNPALAGLFSSYQVNVPQLNVNVDRVKVMQDHVSLDDVFQTLQVYLGSLYVNDFNAFGRTYEVLAQADAPFRSRIEDISNLQVRNDQGQMIPLGSF